MSNRGPYLGYDVRHITIASSIAGSCDLHSKAQNLTHLRLSAVEMEADIT